MMIDHAVLIMAEKNSEYGMMERIANIVKMLILQTDEDYDKATMIL